MLTKWFFKVVLASENDFEKANKIDNVHQLPMGVSHQHHNSTRRWTKRLHCPLWRSRSTWRLCQILCRTQPCLQNFSFACTSNHSLIATCAIVVANKYKLCVDGNELYFNNTHRSEIVDQFDVNTSNAVTNATAVPSARRTGQIFRQCHVHGSRFFHKLVFKCAIRVVTRIFANKRKSIDKLKACEHRETTKNMPTAFDSLLVVSNELSQIAP